MSKADIFTKIATNDDIIFINKVLHHSLSYWPYTKEQLDKILELFKINETYLSKQPVYLTYRDNLFIGFFSFSAKNNQENELDYFIIDHNLIGHGHGKIMWQTCCNIASSLAMKEFIIMSTPEANGFYQKMGAQQIGQHPSAVRENVFMPIFKFILCEL